MLGHGFAPSHVAQPNSAPLAQSGKSTPVKPQSIVPLACGSVHSPCALLACTLLGCAARVHCLGAACARGLGAACAPYLRTRPVGAACARSLGVACGRCLCARPVGTACARGLWALPVRSACGRSLWTQPVGAACARCLGAVPVRSARGAAWARGLGSTIARSTRSWHCAHDHPPMCVSIEYSMPQISFYSLHCTQCLKALQLAIRTHIQIPYVNPAMPYFS